jgi:nitrite reductase/ring-hydroxylating ferredoxin subunit
MTDQIVGRLDEFPEGTRQIFRHGRLEIGVFRIDGRFYALPNICAHQNGPLCQGQLTGTLIASAETQWRPAWVQEGKILVCPWHGLEYDVTTGQCVAHPKIRLRQYRVRVEGAHVVISL